MAPTSHLEAMAITTVDLSSFIKPADDPATNSNRVAAARALVKACHNLGFVKITGHGLTTHEISEALSWTKHLFNLPTSEKMKAPHPPGNMPHRGYSGIGQEKVYNSDDLANAVDLDIDTPKNLRRVADFKESYETTGAY